MDAPALKSGREVRVNGSRLVGLVSCVPRREIENEFFLERFDQASINDVVKMIGVNKRRWVDSETTTKDLCMAAGIRLLADLAWDPKTVDAIIFISQTPDFRLPATACA